MNAETLIDPRPDRLRVSYRIDGRGVDRGIPPRRLLDLIAARIRLLPGITFTEEEPEQVGLMRGTSRGRSFDLRVFFCRTEEGPGVMFTFPQQQDGRGAVPSGPMP